MTNFQFRPFRRSWRKEFGGKQAPETMTCLLLILRKWQEVLNQYIHCVQDQCSFPPEGGLGLMKYQCSGRMDCFSRKELVENKLSWESHTRRYKLSQTTNLTDMMFEKQVGGTPHNPIWDIWSDVQTRVGTPHISIKVVWSDVHTRVGTLHKILRCLRSRGGKGHRTY